MKPINVRRVFVLAGLTTLIVIYAILWLKMISSPAERTGADFIHFYAAGIIARNQGAVHVYDLELQQTVEQEQVGFMLAPGQVLPFNHVPYLIPILSVVVSKNYVASFWRWAILMLICYMIGISLIAWWFRQKEFDIHTMLLISAGAITFYPVFVSLMQGQDTALLFLGGCLWVVGLSLERDGLVGIGLALITVRPQIAVLLAFPLIFKRQKAFGWFCLWAGMLAITSLFILGINGMRSFVNVLLITAGGKWYGTNQPAMVNLIGLLMRLVPGMSEEIVLLIGWVVYGLTLIGLCVFWRRIRKIGEKQIVLTATLALFTVPHLHYHDLAFLLIPTAAVLVGLVHTKYLRLQEAGLAPLAVSLFLLLGSLITEFVFNLPYVVMILLVLIMWFPDRVFFWRRSKDEILS